MDTTATNKSSADFTKAIYNWESRTKALLCSLGGNNYILSRLSIRIVLSCYAAM